MRWILPRMSTGIATISTETAKDEPLMSGVGMKNQLQTAMVACGLVTGPVGDGQFTAALRQTPAETWTMLRTDAPGTVQIPRK